MIPRIGVDLIPVDRVRFLVDNVHREVLQRMLTPDEFADCVRAAGLDLWSVAGRLAAKEAVFKLLDAGSTILPWLAIHLPGSAGCRPTVRLHGSALRLATRAGIRSDISISISHDGDYVVAVAAAVADAATTDGRPDPEHAEPESETTRAARQRRLGDDENCEDATMTDSTSTAIDEVKQWIISRHKDRNDIAPDEDLIESRLVDSLAFVEFIFVIEQAAGREIDMDALDLEDVRTLNAIEKAFLT